MSDLSKFYSNRRPQREEAFAYLKPGGRTESGGLTEAQQQLLPHLQAATGQQKEEASWWTPLEFVFDLLSRPQYMTANLGQDIAEGKDLGQIGSGLWQGLTGERKGDWKTTLFGGKDIGETQAGAGIIGPQEALKGKIPLLSDIPILGDALFKSWEDVIGLAANIFLDPTTYLTFGANQGATAANKAAARAGATEAVKGAIFKAGNLDELARIAKKGFDQNTLKSLMGTSMKKAEEYVSKHVTAKSMAAFNNRIFTDAYRDLLKSTGQEFTGKMLQGVVEGGQEFSERAARQLAEDGSKKAVYRIDNLIRNNPGSHETLVHLKELAATPDIAADQLAQIYKNVFQYSTEAKLGTNNKVMDSVFEQLSHFGNETARLSAPEYAQNFAKLGERKAGDFFGHEFGKSIRQPNVIARGMEAATGKVRQAYRSPRFQNSLFGKAVAWVNEGPVATLKSAFNIKNPYQKVVNELKMGNHYFSNALTGEKLKEVDDIFGKVDDEMLGKVRDVIDYGNTRGITDLQELMNDPGALKLVGDADVEKVRNLVLTERHMVDDVFLKESEAAKNGFLAQYAPRANYLPHIDQIKDARRATKELGPFKPMFAKQQNLSLETIAKQDMAFLQKFLGVDASDAQKMVSELGWSTTNMNLKEMLMYRMQAHARAMASADLAEKFSAFGFKPDWTTIDKDAMASMQRGLTNPLAGLRQVDTEIPAIKGMFFDNDVANILDRVIPVVSSDRGLTGIAAAINGMTTNFKSWATLSPGFHVRNDKSAMLTGFINYGAKFLDPFAKRRALLLSAYGQFGEDAVRNPSSPVGKFLKTVLGFNEYSINKIFNQDIAGKPAKQWVDDVMKRNGIISKSTMGFDLQSAIEKKSAASSFFEKFSPTSNKNILFEKNRELAGIIESHTKVQGFLLDLERMSGKGGQATSGMVDEAVRNVKKFFFDYEDLSTFEQQVMKKVIPFYTWARKNIALQINQLIERTGTMATVAKTTKAMQSEDVDREDMPEYVRQSGGIATGLEEGMAKIFFPDLPYKDINMLPFKFDMQEDGTFTPHFQPEEMFNDFLSSAHPIFKTVTTLAGEGWDPFQRKQLDSQAPAPRAFRLLGNNPQLFAFIDSAARAIGIKDGVGLEVDKNGKLQMDAQIAKLIEDNFVVLKRMDDVGETLSTVFPDIDKALEGMTGIKSRYEGVDKIFKTLAFTFGISRRDMDMNKQEEYAFRDALKRAEQARSEANSKAPGAQRRSDEYYRNYQNRMRTLRSAVR